MIGIRIRVQQKKDPDQQPCLEINAFCGCKKTTIFYICIDSERGNLGNWTGEWGEGAKEAVPPIFGGQLPPFRIKKGKKRVKVRKYLQKNMFQKSEENRGNIRGNLTLFYAFLVDICMFWMLLL